MGLAGFHGQGLERLPQVLHVNAFVVKCGGWSLHICAVQASLYCMMLLSQGTLTRSSRKMGDA